MPKSSKRKAWLTGCGIGCVGILLAVVGMFIVGGLFMRDAMKGFDGAIETREQLDERFGEAASFTPPSDGSIPADRMALFLGIREQTAEVRKEIGGVFSSMNVSDEQVRELEDGSIGEKLGFAAKMSKQAFGMPGAMGRFFETRNRALLDSGMSFGEYTYIYVLAYYRLLEHSPGEGIGDIEIELDTGSVATDATEAPSPPPPPAPPRHSSRLSRRVRGEMIGMLRNMLATLPTEAPDAESAAWRRQLASEIEALEADRPRLPWQDGLPEAIAASLEPYRERLDATYDPTSNEFELMRNRKQGFTIHAE